MNKTELIAEVANKAGLSRKDAEKALGAVVETITEAVVKGDKVLVFHKKRRKRYRKLNGHRQQYTQLQVKSIVG